MWKRIIVSGLAAMIGGFGGLASVTAADTVESVEKELLEQWAKVRTMSATMVIESKMKAGGTSYTIDSSGTYEYMNTDGKVRFRMEMKSTRVSERDGQKRKTETATTSINDGEYLYMLMAQGGGTPRASKMKKDTPPSLDVKAMFETMRRDNVLKLLPDESLDGQAVYVIEATAKDPTAGMAKAMLYFAKDSGIRLKSVSHDSNERLSQTTMYRNVKVNEKIPADRFVFTAPPGVTVMDQTGEKP